ncbi:DUF6603 domain-containing protein [Streptomyces sp. NPDC048516]|uniref:DUF6603 domain-containing protein n=1 Tax=Streptomyces sp. NPDC048516 TaxID=3365565 RepID=UPI00370F7EE9
MPGIDACLHASTVAVERVAMPEKEEVNLLSPAKPKDRKDNISHPYLEKLVSRNPENLEQVMEGGIPLSRHHVIPYAHLLNFWNRVVENEYNKTSPSPEGLKEKLQALVKVILDVCGEYQGFEGNICSFRDFVDKFIASEYAHRVADPPDPPKSRPEGFYRVLRFFAWLPGNLFIGPNSEHRYKDPKGGFERDCAPIVGEDALRIRRGAFANLERYLQNPGLTSEGKEFVDKYIKLIKEGTGDRIWPLRHVDWERGKKNPNRWGIRGVPELRPVEGIGQHSSDWTDDRVEISGKTIELDVWYEEDNHRRLRGSATDIAIGELIEWIDEQWGVGPEIPEGLRELVLRNLTLERLTGPGIEDWNFTIAAETKFGDLATDLLISLRRQTSTAGGQPKSEFTMSAQAGLTLVIDEEETRMWFEGEMRRATGSQSAWSVRGTWKADDKGLSLADLGAALGWPDAGELLEDLPSALQPELREVTLAYDSRTGPLLAVTVGALTVVFAPVRATTGLIWCVQVKAAVDAGLGDVPLLAGALPKEADLRLTSLRGVFASAAVEKPLLETLNIMVNAADLPSFPAVAPGGGLPRGGLLCVECAVPGMPPNTLTVSLGKSAGSRPPALPTGTGDDGHRLPQLPDGQQLPDEQRTAPTDAVPEPGRVPVTTRPGAWVDIGLSIGPLHVRRIGVTYEQGAVWLMVDGALTASGFTMSVDGLGLGVDLGGEGFPVRARLAGLGVEFERPPLRIGGALVNRQLPPPDLMVGGALVVQMPTVGVTAVGAYQRSGGMPSLFVFGRGTLALGGPAPFRLRGVAAGFGFNSSVRLPAADRVADFPLVSGLGGGLSDDPMVVLGELTNGQWVVPREGGIWLAAGLDFSSFELVHGRLLLFLEVGDGLTLGLLGTARGAFPPTGRALAQVQLQLRLVYRSAYGDFSASAQLYDSYVIDSECVLTGGFAYTMWFSPSTHRGDFALTVGGYHPLYAAPAHYPQVPRLGFSWTPGGVSITGTAFFALTPSAVMAGGTLDVRYSAGPVSAWLTAWAQILISWKPLYFRVGIGVTVGASLNLLFVTLKGELGAELDLWGPPTGGTVTAKLVFVTVTIGFGRDRTTTPEKLKWNEFTELLPPPGEILRISAACGLLPDDQQELSGEDPDRRWLVDADGFSFIAETTVPASQVTFQGRDLGTGAKLNIRPMQLTGLDSPLTVRVARNIAAQGATARWEPLVDDGSWKETVLLGSASSALWGAPGALNEELLDPENRLVGGRTGLKITVPSPKTTGDLWEPIADSSFRYEPMPDAEGPLDPAALPAGDRTQPAPAPGAGVQRVADTIDMQSGERGRLHQALTELLAPERHGCLPDGSLAAFAGHVREEGLRADPLLVVSGAHDPQGRNADVTR